MDILTGTQVTMDNMFIMIIVYHITLFHIVERLQFVWFSVSLLLLLYACCVFVVNVVAAQMKEEETMKVEFKLKNVKKWKELNLIILAKLNIIQ